MNAYRSVFIALSNGTGSNWSTAGSITLLTVAALCNQANTFLAVASLPSMVGSPLASKRSPPLAKISPQTHAHQVSCNCPVTPIGYCRMPAFLIFSDCCSSSSRLLGGAEMPAFLRMDSL